MAVNPEDDIPFTLDDDRVVYIRRISPDDEPAVARFHQNLSPLSIYFRYFSASTVEQRIAHARLQRICSDDGGREYVLVAHTLPKGGVSGEDTVAGIARLSKSEDCVHAEFAIIIRDDFQDQGLGAELMRGLISAARDQKIHKIYGLVLRENLGMLHLCKHLGFQVRWDQHEQVMRAELDLNETPNSA